MAQPAREQWGSSAGFVLAAVGSAVGLGNMWRFPYLTAENGGAAFLVLYLVMVVFIGLPILLAEFSVGRGSRLSPVQALTKLGGTAWRPLGILFVITGFIILAYYGVIAGWVLRYTLVGVTEGFAVDAPERFAALSTGWQAVGFQILFMALTIGIVLGGVHRGIERAALILMPLLFIIVAGLAVYAATLTGAGGGYSFYLQTDFSEILSVEVLSAAIGQAFFSLSLGMGAMLTFASYLSRNDHLPNESLVIAGADFLVAFVAGLMVFPLIFALGLSGEVGESTVGALFITLPHAFGEMGPAGRFVGTLFFAALLVGAVTSAISLLEVVTSSAIDSLGWSRGKAAIAGGVLITLVGIPAALDLNVLGLMDRIAGDVFLVIGAIGIAVFVGWRMQDPIGEARQGAEHVPWFPLWRAFLRYVVPVFLLLVLFFSVRTAIGAIRDVLG